MGFIMTDGDRSSTMSELGRSPPTPETALPAPTDAENVRYNPSTAALRELSADLERTTEYGSPAYVTEQRSRSAERTRNRIDHGFDASDYQSVEAVLSAARSREMVCLDRQLGRHPALSCVCRFYVPARHARIALALARLLEPAEADGAPDLLTVQMPDLEEIAIRIFPETGVTTIAGSDYSGEAKKSFLRLFMYRVKAAGGLGLHAGSKRVTIRNAEGDLETVGQLFLGLSATGKSTLTAHDLELSSPEEAVMLQDDVCALLPDGTVAGSEGNGLYIKTIGLDPEEQPAMWAAATHESAVLENVEVDDGGAVDFDGGEYTTNGRAAVLREHLPSAGADIDLPGVDQIFFITRNPLMPPVAKLRPNEAAAAFMCGESVETSAGDPERAGESVRVVGTNPFIIGPEGAEGNRFRDLISRLDVETYVLNTGTIGDDLLDITVEDSVAIIREIARGSLGWGLDESSGYRVPESVPGLDPRAFALDALIDGYRARIDELRTERRRYLRSFDTLAEPIREGY